MQEEAKKPSPSPGSDLEKSSTEELFTRLKSEFALQLAATMKKMEREVESLKKTTANVEALEMRRDEEFRQINANLAKPAQVMEQLKAQFQQMIEKQEDAAKK